MGWMHDMLDYTREDPVHRKWHHNKVTFSMMYAYSEAFILPFSHDEVVHGKRSMIDKMPGDVWQKHANLRALYGYMFVHPGKKLLFMGGEVGQWREWNDEWQVDWEVLGDSRHAGLQRWLRDLNRTYAAERPLWQDDYDPRGFSWIDCNDHENSVLSFIRHAGIPGGEPANAFVVAVVNFTPVVRHGYRLGVPLAGAYTEVLNSDAEIYGGSNVGNQGRVMAAERPSHGHAYSITLTVPPLGFVLLKPNK
jgi:1,4-alpha-glucan branching enzyme